LHNEHYFAPRMGAEYCDVCVCLPVCPLAYLEKHTAELYQFFVRVAYSHGSVLI